MQRLGLVGAFLVGVLLSACGGGGGGGSDGGSPVQTTPFEGLWTGTATSSVTGTPIDVLGGAVANGETIFFARTACHVYAGTGTSSGQNLSLTATAYSKDYCYGAQDFVRQGWIPTSTNSPSVTTLSASGAFSPKTSATFNYTTGVGDTGTLRLNYLPIFERGANLANLAGTYSNGPQLSVTVAADGRLSGRDVVGPFRSNVTYSGSLRVVDASKNLYRITLTMTRSAGTTTYDGFAYLTDSAEGRTNDALVVFARDVAGTGAFVHYWIRQ